MTVTVIAEPKPENLFERLCDNCACTLQYARNDITTRKQETHSDVFIMYEIMCPRCRYLNTVNRRPVVDNPFVGRITRGGIVEQESDKLHI